MISIEELKRCEGKNVKLYLNNGKIWEGNCFCYQPPQDDDEEYMLEFPNTLIYHSQIEKVEILD